MKRLLFFVIIILTVIEIKSSYDCTSLDCISFVNSIKNNMNRRADPCEDFNEYACGNWEKNNPIPASHFEWNTLKILHEDIKTKLIDILNGTVDPLSPTNAFQKAKRMYQSCMNLTAIEVNGVKTISSQLERTGGWPAKMPLNAWTPNVTSLHEMHKYYVKTLGLQLFYEMGALHNRKMNTASKHLWINRLNFPHFQRFWMKNSRNSSIVSQYIDNITEVIKILTPNFDEIRREDVENDVYDLANFERVLTEILIATRKQRTIGGKQKLMTINHFQIWFSNNSYTENSKIIWIDFLQNLFNDTGMQLTDNDMIRVHNKDYIMNVIKLLDTTPVRTIVNYIQWSFIRKVIEFGPKNLRNIASTLNRLERKNRLENNRAKMCLSSIKLEHALSYEYVKLHFPLRTKEFINGLSRHVTNTANEVLEQTSWLSRNEKNFAKDKLSAIEHYTGYPDWYDNSSAVDDYYQKCIITDNYMKNIIEVENFHWNLELSEWRKPMDIYTQLRPMEVEAVFLDHFNTMVFTAALFQNPIFSEKHPRSFHYGTFGTLIGHELSHVFDDEGARFDKHGHKVEGWSNTTNDKFNSKAECFVKQYNRYKIYEGGNVTLYVNGERSKNENIGDLHGMKFAYRAYKESSIDAFVSNSQLPGLESYTDEQLFFLAYANFWCSAIRPERKYYEYLSRDYHPASKFRIIGTLSNMKEFSAAFNCSVNSTMNPTTKCAIWGTNN